MISTCKSFKLKNIINDDAFQITKYINYQAGIEAIEKIINNRNDLIALESCKEFLVHLKNDQLLRKSALIQIKPELESDCAFLQLMNKTRKQNLLKQGKFVLRRVAVASISIIGAVSIMIASVVCLASDVREAFYNTITGQTKTVYVPVEQSTQSAIWAPTTLPSGYRLLSRAVNDRSSIVNLIYQNESGQEVNYFYHRSGETIATDDEYSSAEIINQNGSVFYYLADRDGQTCLFGQLQDTDGFRIDGSLSKEEMIKMGKSIQYTR